MPQKFTNLTSKKISKTVFRPLDQLRQKYELKKVKKAEIVKPPKVDASPKTISFKNINEAINAESELGRTIFGPIPVGHQREFFKFKDNIWIWHENWQEKGKKREITVRYEVREDGVYKKISPEKPYQKITGDELENFSKALRAYLKVIKEKLY